MTTIFSVNDPTAPVQAAAVIAAGGMILFPTDTVYGLGVDATSDSAVAMLCNTKGRDTKKPTSMLVRDVAAATHWGQLSVTAHRLTRHFLPGPLTLVVPKQAHFVTGIGRDQATVGIRIIDHPFCRSFTTLSHQPITATSANPSGQPTTPTVTEILESFGKEATHIDLVIDAGPLTTTLPSTIIDLTGPEPKLLREGALPWQTIRDALS